MKWIPAAIAVAVTATAGWALPVYREGPPPAHTGGFGEPLCSECHFGTPVDSDAGSLTVRAPETYSPGASYSLEVVLRHPDMRAAGFQLAARVADGGDDAGAQAGSLAGTGTRTAVTADTATGVQYAHQTAAGASLERAGVARWTVEWTAPSHAAPVVLHAAGNAANDDASEFGDAVFTARVRIRPQR